MCSQLKARCVLNESENLPVLSDTCDLNESDNLPVLLDTGDHPVQSDCNMFSLKVELLNARSIKNKLHDILYLLNVTKPDVICITET